MSSDLRTLLAEAAPQPRRTVDGVSLVVRGRRRRRAKRFGAIAGVTSLIALTLVLARSPLSPRVPDVVERPDGTSDVAAELHVEQQLAPGAVQVYQEGSYGVVEVTDVSTASIVAEGRAELGTAQPLFSGELTPGTYRLVVHQLPCSTSCPSEATPGIDHPALDPAVDRCERSITARAGQRVTVVVTVTPGVGCAFVVTSTDRDAAPEGAAERIEASGDLPHPLIASVDGVIVQLNPSTGAVVRELAVDDHGGQARISMDPSGRQVFHENHWTGCATVLWRTPLDGHQREELGPGRAPAVNPLGDTLAYVGYDPCAWEAHRLVLRDLEDGTERSWPLEHPDGEVARLESLSWDEEGQILAVEVSYTRTTGDDIGQPHRYEIQLVDTAQPVEPIDTYPAMVEGDHTIAWRNPTFRGEHGTLLVVEMCCDIDPRRPPAETAELYRLIEVDPVTGETLDILVESALPITDVDADLSGDHILYVVDGGGDREPGMEEGLFRYREGATVRLAGSVAFADWLQVPRAIRPASGDDFCGANPKLADVDGDGNADFIEHAYHADLPEPAQLRVCTASGMKAHLPGLGQTEELRIDDIERDGRAEIFFGGTSVSAVAGSLAVWRDDLLAVVVDESGDEFWLEAGADGWDEETDLFDTYFGWGCQDVDGDAVRDLVTARAERVGDELDARFVGYRIDGTTAVVIWEDRRTIPLPADPWTFPGLPECFPDPR